jgi:hypothetical protein
VQRRMDRHGTGAAALGRSDNGGHAANMGGSGGASDVGATADMWGWVTSGPVASGGVRKGEERMRQWRPRALTGGTGSTVPPVRF